MGAPELLALSLGLSVAVAALGLAAGRLIEGATADPRLRERVWSAALLAPVLAPVLVGLSLLAPPPVREAASTGAAVAADGLDLGLDPAWIAWSVIALAGGLALARSASLARRGARLARLIRRGEDAGPALTALIRATADEMDVPPPAATVSPETAEPLLAGLGRARLILPSELAAGPIARAVVAHELAHLKRGDHRTLWAEEILLALLAINPLMPALRARRAAAREEACDALALSGAAPETRRAYAQTLIETLRKRAAPQDAGALPALTFTGAGRTTAMHRLKAVVNPAAPAGRRARLTAAAAGLAVLTALGGATVALAAQREPEIRTPRAEAQPGVVGGETPVEVAGRGALSGNLTLQAVERVPETARVGEIFQMRTPAGRIVEAWRGQPADHPDYVAPSGPVLQARLGEPPVAAGRLVQGTISQGPAAPFAGRVVGAPASGQGQTGAFNGAATGQADQMHEVEIVAHGTQNRGAPPPPPVARRDRIRPAQPGAPVQEVEIVAARGARNGQQPPVAYAAPPRPGQTSAARGTGSQEQPAAVYAAPPRPGQTSTTRRAPPPPPPLLRVRPARPGAPTSSPPAG